MSAIINRNRVRAEISPELVRLLINFEDDGLRFFDETQVKVTIARLSSRQPK
jgi:hypothetical protein